MKTFLIDFFKETEIETNVFDFEIDDLIQSIDKNKDNKIQK